MRSLLLQTSPLVLLATPAFSWGNLGHRTVGYLSQMYMTPDGLSYFNNIVKPNGQFDISDAAIWADSHKIGQYAYTYNWHFIDARDDPPLKCQVVFQRDCDERDECDTKKAPGCVVGAIVNQVSNYTYRQSFRRKAVDANDAFTPDRPCCCWRYSSRIHEVLAPLCRRCSSASTQ